MKDLVHASTGRNGRRFGKGASSRKPSRRVTSVPVFIAYADVPAARDAMSRVTHLLQSSRGDCRLEPMLWRFDQLGESRWCEMAWRDAASAHALVLAMREFTPLSPGAAGWLSELAARERGAEINVLMLVGEDDVWTISLQQTRPVQSARAAPVNGSRVSMPAMPATGATLIAPVAA